MNKRALFQTMLTVLGILLAVFLNASLAPTVVGTGRYSVAPHPDHTLISGSWSTKAPMSVPRDRAAALDGKIYVMGGTNSSGALASLREAQVQLGTPLAFVSDRDGNEEIYVISADGSTTTNVSRNPAVDGHPDWSPDGQSLVFHSGRDGECCEIYTMKADGTNVRRLTNSPGWDGQPAWSPDGQKIAFESLRSGAFHIYVMNADGSNVRDLGPGGYPDWSPDGSKLVFHAAGVGGAGDIYLINADGTGRINITNSPEDNQMPTWSPDGRTIAYAVRTGSGWDLYFYDIQTGSSRRFLSSSTYYWWPVAWSADSRRIAFVSRRDGQEEIYIVNVDGSNLTRLTNHPAKDWWPAWAGGGCVGGTTPVDVMLVIDRSGSMSGQPLADEKVAAKGFVDRMNMAQDQVGLVSFADSATLNRQLTHDANAVKSAIDALTAGGQTNMTAAINAAQAELQSSRHNPAARPVMLFMSDGVPTVDTPASAIAAAQAAKNAGTRIFAIGLGSVDDNLMRQIASSPADYYYAPSSSDLSAIYQAIAGQVICAQAKVKVSPSSKRVPLSGGSFTMDIVAEEVSNLAAYQVELTYNPAIVHVTAVTPGPFLGSTGRTVTPVGPVIDNAAGVVRFGAFTFGTQPGVNGTGVLATITFQPRARGTSDLHLQNLQIADPSGNSLSATTQDGQVEIVSCFGDFDGDGDVDILDLQRAASHWNCRTGDACYDVQFDTEPDGDIDVFDVQRFAAAWGTTCPTTQARVYPSIQTKVQTAVDLELRPANVLITTGEVFTLTVWIQNANNVGAFQTDVVYDPAVVEVEGVAMGAFLGSSGRTVNLLGPQIDNTAGRVTFGAYTIGSQPGASGSGDLAYIRLRGKGVGRTSLELQHTGVSDPQGNQLFLGNLEGSTIIVSSEVFRVSLPVVLKNH